MTQRSDARQGERGRSTTSKLTPTSAKTAIHIVASPIRVKDADSIPRQLHECRDLAQVVIHQRDICRLNRGTGTCCAHGEADLGFSQRRRVVNTVTYHAHYMIGLLELANHIELICWKQVSARLVDA
ncbi:hypothetical protein WR25_02511 [Diploscapter pachys]|uniref:Uncharacterized protein n=1 Tax=Diploscapter pachys TaxID=2018661 RepID=A0A2A2K2E2_9BILA|nr:hypothetical protein WR25_02511 [Diploscapter pachys]